MKAFLLSLLPILSGAFLVYPVTQERVFSLASSHRDVGDGKVSLYTDGFSTKEPDLERAKDCASHFGKCSLKEIKELKEGLRQKRIQDAVIGSIDSVTGSTAPEDLFQQRLLEEELSLQLSLLHNELPPPYLFNEDGALENERLSAKVKAAEQEQMIELLEEEGVIESLAICALIALAMLVPQLGIN